MTFINNMRKVPSSGLCLCTQYRACLPVLQYKKGLTGSKFIQQLDMSYQALELVVFHKAK